QCLAGVRAQAAEGQSELRACSISPRSPRCLAVAARWWRVAQRLPDWQVKPRAAAWRPPDGNPQGRICLPASLRNHSVVDRRPLLRSFLACAQTAPGAGHAEILNRLLTDLDVHSPCKASNP